MAVEEPHPGGEEGLVHAAAEEGQHGHVEPGRVHVARQLHQHLLRAALAQVVDEEEDLFHFVPLPTFFLWKYW